MNVKIGLACVAVLTLAAVVYNLKDRDEIFHRLTDSVRPGTNSSHPDTAKTVVPAGGITNGITEVDFKSIFGEPKGQISRGSNQTLQYDGFRVTLTNGTIVDLPAHIDQIYARINKPSTLEKIKDFPNQIPAPQELKSALAKRKSYTLLNSKSEPIDHSSLVVTGKVTVVDFYSEELEACAVVNKELDELVKTLEGVELKKINIDSWNSDIAKKYHITTVPDIRILNRYGFLVSQPVTRIEVIDEKIDLSRVAAAIDKAQ